MKDYATQSWLKPKRDFKREAELTATVEVAIKLADAVENHEDTPVHKWALKCLWLVNKVKATPATNLNAIKREVFIRGYDEALYHFELVQHRNIQSVAANRYPDKE